MNRTEFEKFLGKKVEVKMFDGDIMQGILHKTGEEEFKNNPNLYLLHNYYFLMPLRKYLFRKSHVVKIREI